MSVCLSARISQTLHTTKLHEIFCTCFVSDVAVFVLKRDVKFPLINLYVLIVVVAGSSSDDNAIGYALLVL